MKDGDTKAGAVRNKTAMLECAESELAAAIEEYRALDVKIKRLNDTIRAIAAGNFAGNDIP